MLASPRVVVLVEGESDRVALEALAVGSGRDLAAEGVLVMGTAGVTNLRAHALRLGPRGRGLTLAGLYDAPAEPVVRRALDAAGLGPLDPGGVSGLGFHGCSDDLEDELVRALGVDGVERVVALEGEARSLRRLAAMPAQRGWSRERVLHRFLGSRSGRKARYARALVDAVVETHGPDRAPYPLRAVLARALDDVHL